MPDCMKECEDKLAEVRAALNTALRLLTPPTRVLIVEDDDHDWFHLEKQLTKFRCVYTRRVDGEQAVEEIKTGKYDIILLDQKVPKLTGNEILRATAGFRDNCKVFMVTGYPGSPQISKALEEGAVLTLPKPITLEQLSVFLMPYATE